MSTVIVREPDVVETPSVATTQWVYLLDALDELETQAKPESWDDVSNYQEFADSSSSTRR